MTAAISKAFRLLPLPLTPTSCCAVFGLDNPSSYRAVPNISFFSMPTCWLVHTTENSEATLGNALPVDVLMSFLSHQRQTQHPWETLIFPLAFGSFWESYSWLLFSIICPIWKSIHDWRFCNFGFVLWEGLSIFWQCCKAADPQDYQCTSTRCHSTVPRT